MEIIKTYDWHRRDFSYDAKCEHCGFVATNQTGGYDDDNYYNNVIPGWKCPKCGESSRSKDSGKSKSKIIPKYDPNKIL